MKNFRNRVLGIGLIIGLSTGFAAAGENTAKRAKKRSAETVRIKAVPWGPSQADVDAAKARAEKSDAVRAVLGNVKHRLVGFDYLEDRVTDKALPTPAPTRFRAIFYDYTNDLTYVAEGDFAGRETIAVRQETFEPGVGGAELDAAFAMVKADPEFAALGEKYEIDQAMPPTTNLNGERLVNIIIKSLITGENKIVGVSFKRDKVVRYENNAPPTAKAAPDACGIPSAGQGSTSNGTAGQYQITVTQGQTTLWEMLVVRPSASSGALGERSGIEVRDVRYKGKSVLKRGHAPILNVQYDNNACGPFRDWQYAEGFFQIPATDVDFPTGSANGGFAIINNGGIATTSVETRNDAGNFKGVAVYQQNVGYGPEVVMVTEMNAGWYRYIMEWRFGSDGVIRPRYGFGSTTNSCVCIQRNHHVYWRFDFDIVQPNNKVFKVERGRKFLTPLSTEASIFRNYQLNRGFLVQNSNGDEAYQITPNTTDGTVTNSAGVLTDTFGHGDFWLLRFQGTAGSPGELDDPNSGSAANLNPWVTGESILDQDVVIWYGAHQTRVDDTSLNRVNSNIIAGMHVIGPDLRPVRW